MSENITVRSIVDRFLEHSRIFYFENACQPEIFVGSADWMPRNFFRRIEVVFPIEDGNLRERVISELLALPLAGQREGAPDAAGRLVSARPARARRNRAPQPDGIHRAHKTGTGARQGPFRTKRKSNWPNVRRRLRNSAGANGASFAFWLDFTFCGCPSRGSAYNSQPNELCIR